MNNENKITMINNENKITYTETEKDFIEAEDCSIADFLKILCTVYCQYLYEV